MIGSPTLSRRAKAAILASPPRALRLDMDARLSARRATQPEREQAYRERQARQIHSAFEVDAVLRGNAA